MIDVRSRAGVVAVTAGAAVLLAMPVVALGQVPGVDEVVGGIQERVEGVAPAPVAPLPAPPVSLPAPPPAPAPKSQSGGSAPAAPAPPAPAPAPSPQSTPAASPGGGEPSRSATVAASSKRVSAASGGGRGEERRARADEALGGKTANASQDGGAPTDVEIAGQRTDAPEAANPSTLPFTGLQLAMLGVLGLAALVAGLALRRGVRSAG